MDRRPEFRPGCFGSPLAYSDTRKPCSACPYRDACRPAAEACAKNLRARYRIDEAMKPFRAKQGGKG